jgi:phage tail sheath protein FI
MPDYRAPGVYVEEVPSAVKPIAGVSTSTAAFIGVFGDDRLMYPGDRIAAETAGTGDDKNKVFDLKSYPVLTDPGSYAVTVAGKPVAGAELANDTKDERARVTLRDPAPKKDDPVVVEYVRGIPVTPGEKITGELVGIGDKRTAEFPLANYPVLTKPADFQVRFGNEIPKGQATLENIPAGNVAVLKLAAAPDEHVPVTVDYVPAKPLARVGEVQLCTNFSDFTRSFGGFTTDKAQRNLAHAVYGFFNNGGSRCYVVRVANMDRVKSALAKFAEIDEIAIVAAPGIANGGVSAEIRQHCEIATRDRFAIFDSAEDVNGLTLQDLTPPPNSNYAAFYFPWLQVFDPVQKAVYPKTDGTIYVPPSGHIAGIYARVDAERGVHKAPGNEVVVGALGLRYTVSKAQQAGLNPAGVNCIRSLNGNIQVWGARTVGGDANADLKYINVRRTLLFLRKSIEQGMQWVVFDPNGPELWQRITRNITAFLTVVWRSGALFGTTAAEAFYVKCDAETNPPELRDLGQVVTEIGVAIVRPAEFVIFRISQFTAPG